jgi:uracil-DNA glycosylase
MQSELTEPKHVTFELYDVNSYHPNQLPTLFPQLVPVGWIELFTDYTRELEDAGKVLKRLIESSDVIVCPKPYDIFRAYTLTPWWEVKVVIIGQDPYFQVEKGVPAATGCSFECRPGNPIRQSLKNILLVLSKTIPDFKFPDSGDLTKWARQGVLLANACPTVEFNKPGSHKDIWRFFMLRVLQFLSKKRKNVVYMLWGRDAQSYRNAILTSANFILEASHPVAQGRSNDFLTCDHFNQCNRHLEATGQSPIDWTL